jgi:hypothetical protein
LCVEVSESRAAEPAARRAEPVFAAEDERKDLRRARDHPGDEQSIPPLVQRDDRGCREHERDEDGSEHGKPVLRDHDQRHERCTDQA